MSYVENRHSVFIVPSPKIVKDLHARRTIQRGERFVEKKRAWLGYKRARESYSLALAA